MATLHCGNCGADIEDTARFCRQCGRPSNLFDATTRTLDQPSEYQAPTRPVSAAPTAPSYVSPTPMPPAPFPLTQQTRPIGHRRTVIAISVLAGLLFIALIAIALAVMFVSSGESDEPTGQAGVSAPEMPSTPRHPEMPAPPGHPEMPAPGAQGEDSSISRTLVYPGSETIMKLNNDAEGNVLQLRTKDPVDKVIDWYTAKLKAEKIVKLPVGNTVLRAGKTVVFITNMTGETNILIKQGVGFD